MNKIYVVRHGQSTWNEKRIWAGGNADIPLTDLGRLQAKEACSTLRQHNFTHIYSSSLQRASETATIIAKELNINNWGTLGEFNERNYGKLGGLTSMQIEEQYPDFFKDWRAGKPGDPPEGEDWQKFVDRVNKGLNYMSTIPGCCLVVGHMSVLRAIEYNRGEKQRRHANLEGIWINSV